MEKTTKVYGVEMTNSQANRFKQMIKDDDTNINIYTKSAKTKMAKIWLILNE